LKEEREETVALKGGNSPSSQSTSSCNDETLRRRWRPPRQPVNHLRDMKFSPPEFEGNLDLDLYLEWV